VILTLVVLGIINLGIGLLAANDTIKRATHILAGPLDGQDDRL